MTNEMAKHQLQPTLPRREAYRSEVETQRNAIYRACPRDLVIDRRHALVRVGATMVTGVGAVMARRYLIRGLLGDGFTRADVADALAASADEMDRAQGELPIHEPGAKQLREWMERTLPAPLDVLDTGRSMTNTERRQGTLHLGSRGWRTPAGSPPQTQTPPHA